MSGIWAFLSAVVGHWLTIMTGIAAILIGLLQYWTNKRLLPPAWIAVGLFILFIATYQTWAEEHAASLAEQCKIEKAERRSAVKNQLATFMNGFDTFLFANLTKDTPPDQVNKWFSDAAAYIDKVKGWVRDNLGPAALAKVGDITNLPAMEWNRSISAKHNNAINNLTKFKENINDLIGSSVWDDFDARANASTEACTE
jgi:hypothetical protein